MCNEIEMFKFMFQILFLNYAQNTNDNYLLEIFILNWYGDLNNKCITLHCALF